MLIYSSNSFSWASLHACSLLGYCCSYVLVCFILCIAPSKFFPNGLIRIAFFLCLCNNISGYGLESREIGVRFAALEDFSPLHNDQTGYGANQAPMHMATEAISLRVKRQ